MKNPEPLDDLLPIRSYKHKTDHIHIFSRAQLKYSLTADDYLNRYVDRPLLLSHAHDVYQKHFEHSAALARKYGLDGLAFFPGNGFAQETYDFARQQPEDFRLLTEIYSEKDPLPFVSMALQLPNSMKAKGKLLLSTYNTSSAKLQQWSNLTENIRKKFPDKTLIVPDLNHFGEIPLSTWIGKFNKGNLSAQDIEKAKEDIRQWLRVSDGIYYSSGEILRKDDRTFNRDFYENFIIRLFKNILAEEEFKDKCLGLVANLGHENHTRIGFTLSSNGTRTLRDSMEAALSANPDYINLPEWDELNESTCIMPTVFDGYSTMRIMRYYTSRARGSSLTPIPEDDQTLPNLIFSHRKLLAAGEKLELELLNVPDSESDGSYTVAVILKDMDGAEIYRSGEFSFKRNQLQEHRITIPSESLIMHQLLMPELEICENEKMSVLADGLHSIHLRATWNWDYKWVKQPVRDLLKVNEIAFSLIPTERKDTLKAAASIKAEESLAVFELLENDNPIYLHALKDGTRWRDQREHRVLSISWKSEQGFNAPLLLKGSIELKGATGEWTRMIHPGENGVDATAIQGQKLLLDGQRSSIWQRRVLLSLPADQLQNAVLSVALQDTPPMDIRVEDILKRGAFGITGKQSVNFVISRFTRQLHFPEPLKTKDALFDVDIWPESPDAVYQVRAIGESGRIYRSKPISLLKQNATEGEIAFFSDTNRTPIRAKVAENRIPDIRYEFSPKHGDLLATPAGRLFWGVLGGFTTLITERGASPGDGSTFMGDAFTSAAFTGQESAPKWVPLGNEEYALEFNGQASYVNLPQGVIPRRSGYTIEMEIQPEDKRGIQPLLANYTARFGTLALYLENGELKADFLHDLQNLNLTTTKGIASGIKVPSGEWSKLTISYDQAQLIIIARGEKFIYPLAGPGAHDVVTALGYYQKQWYKGKLKSLRIQHRPLE